MIELKELNRKAKLYALGGSKIPHGISNPVIREHSGKMYIAYFVYTYSKEELKDNQIHRPVEWLLLDIDTGDLVARIRCNERDFCNESFEKLYSLKDVNIKAPTKDYFEIMDQLFNTVRASIKFGNNIDLASYKSYLNSLLKITPTEYRVFYIKLSI